MPVLTAGVVTLIQVLLAAVIGLYFWSLLRQQQGSRVAIRRESRHELERLQQLRAISLTEPLSELTRPTSFEEVIGQEDGLKALRAALCGPNPQHVIIYGPPGVGKTAAARLVLEEARRNRRSPFGEHSRFVEIDATTARFDERGIADPLIGCVHDPIYQGAGSLGIAGIPQPKPGAVTRAHGGILFIDEIGELHPVQMNKLLKVLEDRKVFLESAYYNSEDPNVPAHIRDIFEHGLPADFRLVGATTRLPEEIPPAIRSRCMEIFFRPLTPDEVARIARNAARRIGIELTAEAADMIGRYARNGREAVNMVQIAAGVADGEGRRVVDRADIGWVVSSGQYSPRPEKRVPPEPMVGRANGLAVYGPNMGVLIELEVAAHRAAAPGAGRITVTGLIEEEEFGGMGRPLKRRKSMARSSVETVLTALRSHLDLNPFDYDIHVNFPGGVPVDGPSAGVPLAVAIYSALTGIPVRNTVAMTGEVSVQGWVKPVGGIPAKIDAARHAGADTVVIPSENHQEIGDRQHPRVVPVTRLAEALDCALAGGARAAAGLDRAAGSAAGLAAAALPSR
ncbi:MAG: ATP-dependent protease LonB [Thermaerobacter sp.]|nr:ATP-dependent protease LonB [Bacillota bacterium]REJ38180.1 MAG: ATP-dependent protease LonB [Bacillota bacterium]